MCAMNGVLRMDAIDGYCDMMSIFFLEDEKVGCLLAEVIDPNEGIVRR